jgi:hypothetical protein
LQNGVGPEQLRSLEHPAVHVCVFVLQTPLAPAQSLFTLHWTHVLAAVSQTGVPGRHAVTFPALHSTHAPLTQAGSSAEGQAADAAEPLSPLQGTQVLVAVLQTGFEPVHADGFPAVHSTQVLVAVLQTAVEPVHRESFAAVHCTQAPVARLQAGAVVVGQAAEAAVPLSPLQGTQSPPAQTGFVPEHWAFDVHSTQVFVDTLQSGVGAAHCMSFKQGTQTPLTVLQTGVGAAHWLSLLQVAVHVLVVRLQNGVCPPHCPFDVHWTQACVAVLHTGV